MRKNLQNFDVFFSHYIWICYKKCFFFTLYMNICKNVIYGQKMKKVVFLLFILCPNMGIIRITIHNFSALKKKKKKILEKNRKNTMFFQFCPQMRKKQKNCQKSSFSCILWKIRKKRQNFAGFSSIFRLFLLLFWHPTAKMKKFKKNKKRRVFSFSP